MSTQTYVLGQEVQHKGELYLVVRIDKGVTLFEKEDGSTERVEEEFVQLKRQDGDYEFVTLFTHAEPFKKQSNIKALPIMNWRSK